MHKTMHKTTQRTNNMYKYYRYPTTLSYTDYLNVKELDEPAFYIAVRENDCLALAGHYLAAFGWGFDSDPYCGGVSLFNDFTETARDELAEYISDPEDLDDFSACVRIEAEELIENAIIAALDEIGEGEGEGEEKPTMTSKRIIEELERAHLSAGNDRPYLEYVALLQAYITIAEANGVVIDYWGDDHWPEEIERRVPVIKGTLDQLKRACISWGGIDAVETSKLLTTLQGVAVDTYNAE